MFHRTSHGVGSGALLVVIRAVEGGRAGVDVVPFCNIEAAGGEIIPIVPAPSCAGQLVSADPVLISLIDWRGHGRGGGMCGAWSEFWGMGLVSSGSRCNGERKVCHRLLDLVLGLLELVGELLVGDGKVCQCVTRTRSEERRGHAL